MVCVGIGGVGMVYVAEILAVHEEKEKEDCCMLAILHVILAVSFHKIFSPASMRWRM